MGQPTGDEEHAQPVVLTVAEASQGPAVQLDHSNHGLGTTVARAVEVGPERLAAW